MNEVSWEKKSGIWNYSAQYRSLHIHEAYISSDMSFVQACMIINYVQWSYNSFPGKEPLHHKAVGAVTQKTPLKLDLGIYRETNGTYTSKRDSQ